MDCFCNSITIHRTKGRDNLNLEQEFYDDIAGPDTRVKLHIDTSAHDKFVEISLYYFDIETDNQIKTDMRLIPIRDIEILMVNEIEE